MTILRHVPSFLTLAVLAVGGGLTSCSGDAQAGESAAAAELRKARDAFSNWASMKADEFEKASKDVLAATERRIGELRTKVANSEAAEEAREALAALEAEGKELKDDMARLADKTGEQATEARKAIAGKLSDWQTRLEAAWDELTR